MSDKNGSWDKVPFIQRLKNIKHIELIVVAIFVVVLLMVYISSSKKTKTINQNITSEAKLEEYGEMLENKIAGILTRINGAGDVSVLITFDGRISYEYATESEEITTSNSISNGTNTKTTTNEKIIIVNQNGKSGPLIVKEIYPPVSGVVVVSKGASNVAVRLNIISAVETALGISANKIMVLEAN